MISYEMLIIVLNLKHLGKLDIIGIIIKSNHVMNHNVFFLVFFDFFLFFFVFLFFNFFGFF